MENNQSTKQLNNFEENIQRFNRAMAAAAKGDFAARVEADFDNESLAMLATNYNEMMTEIESQMNDVWSFAAKVRATGDSVAGDTLVVESASERVTAEFEDITEGTDEQSDRLQKVASEVETLSASVEEIASSATEVARTADIAAERGADGRQAAEHAVDEIENVKRISDSIVEKIRTLETQMNDVSETIDVISEIADQTNLLALNANIEAARAGQDGDGFAVVAKEVKNLAEEAQESADEIESVIETATGQTEETVTEMRSASESISTSTDTVQDALKALSDTVDNVQSVNDSIQEVSNATDQQAESNSLLASEVEEIAELSEDVDAKAESVGNAAEQQAALTKGISTRARGLRDNVTNLESSLKTFAVNKWGKRINDHCRSAGINWRQHEDETLRFAMSNHMFTETTEPFLEYFERLTGIEVSYDIYPEEDFFGKIERDFITGNGAFDGFLLGLWPASNYHANGWVRNLNQFLGDPSLTDSSWYHMEDYPDSLIDQLTYDRRELVAMPVVVGVYGCLAYDRPTFQRLGLEEPTDFESLTHAAKMIHESDQTDRYGIASRGSADPVSTANWSTMFKSYGADWVDYRTGEAKLNSQAGVQSLETYAELLGSYGPPGASDFNWYRSNNSYGQGETGMLYHSPATSGVLTDRQYNRTKWLPPLSGPTGQRLASVWMWSLGISRFASNPEAAWLFIQWATSREMSLLLSTRQWDGHDSAGYARTNWIPQQEEYHNRGQADSWDEAFNEAITCIPSDPSPIPLEFPENMEIMEIAADAMNAAITGRKSAQAALDDAAPDITAAVRTSKF